MVGRRHLKRTFEHKVDVFIPELLYLLRRTSKHASNLWCLIAKGNSSLSSLKLKKTLSIAACSQKFELVRVYCFYFSSQPHDML